MAFAHKELAKHQLELRALRFPAEAETPDRMEIAIEFAGNPGQSSSKETRDFTLHMRNCFWSRAESPIQGRYPRSSYSQTKLSGFMSLETIQFFMPKIAPTTPTSEW
jgi:hypothetical protein